MIQPTAAEFSLPGLVTVEPTFEVPLDHLRPESSKISLFARELAARDGRTRPCLVFFPGGPGFEAIHHVVELPPDSPAFRHDAEAETTLARNPIYAILHEASWANGFATQWSAERQTPEER